MELPAPALIRIHRCGSTVDRIAAFTWITKTGIAWLEDSYLDPYSCGHAFHVLKGKLTETKDGFHLKSKTDKVQILSQEQVRANPESYPKYLLESLQSARDVFRTDFGKDWAEEFERMTHVLKAELGR